jgi:hypothetical protein
VRGLRIWLSAIELPLLEQPAAAQLQSALAVPTWFAAAATVMSDDTARQVLAAVAAAAAAAAAGLVARSDAALAAPCAESALRWCACRLSYLQAAAVGLPSRRTAAAHSALSSRYSALRCLFLAAGQEAWASAFLADVLAHLRCVATNALVM